jgi:hypothetical protein
MIEIDNLKWDIFFGGAGREITIQKLVDKKFNINRILVPRLNHLN